MNRVFVRPPTESDCAAFIAAVKRSRALHCPWVAKKATTKLQFEKYLNRYSSGAHYSFLVVQCATKEIVGVINANDIVRGSFQSASLGYYAFSPHVRQGLMHEGMMLVLKEAFSKLKLHRLEANIQPANLASIALVKKCGFVREGISRRMLKVGGKWKDHERWAIVKEDFRRKSNR
jgi:[ribosomal protein S5]-alanine N-acetyltransferase